MKKEDTYDFLLRAAIPSIDDSKRLPEELRRERGKKKENGINVIALFLYTTITDYLGELSSEYLINELLNKYEDSGIGVIQKLVNMTLKYMLILQLFDRLDGYIIAESSCDCPLDSRISDSLGMSDLKWTKDF